MDKFNKIMLSVVLILSCVLLVRANTTVTGLAIINSTLDSTPIGSASASTGIFSAITGPLTGNASTATAFQSAPSACGTTGAVLETGIGTTGTPTTCGPNIRWGLLATSCTTAASSFSVCTSSGNSWSSSFPSGNQVYVACSSGSSTDGRGVLLNASGNQTTFSITVSTMGSVAETLSNITCIGVQI